MINLIKNIIKTQFYTPLRDRFATTVFSPSEKQGYYDNLKIQKIVDGYNNKLQYGSSGINNIINYRRSWIVGKDVTVSVRKEMSRENKVIGEIHKQLLNQNFYLKIATYLELEGKCLIYLNSKFDSKTGKVLYLPNILPYHEYKYKTILDDYNNVTQVVYREKNSTTEKTIQSKDFILINYNLISNDLENSSPSIAYIVEDVIRLDECLKSWQEINDRFAKTTVIFEVDDWRDATTISNIIKGKQESIDSDGIQRKWKIGEGLAVKGRAKTLEFSNNGIESLKDEIIMRTQKISGHSGIPIFLLGFPELMSNRATASEMVESIINKTSTEKEIIQQAIKELFVKSLAKYNLYTGDALYSDLDSINVVLPVVSQNEIKSLIDKFEPLFASKVISKKTFRELIPGVDPEIEEFREKEESENTELLNNNAIDSIINRMNTGNSG